MLTRIPIANLYYILCYAWNRLEDDELVDARELAGQDTVNLLAQLLAAAVAQALRRGLNRDYQARTGEIHGIRGRLLFAQSKRRLLFEHGCAACEFDEIDHNNLPNRIVRATLENLRDAESLEERSREAVMSVLRQFRGIDSLDLHPGLFRRVRLHRSNAHYGMLLSICELAYNSMLPEPGEGPHRFRSFVEDHELMAAIYQDFVHNFYAAHAEECGYSSISAPIVQWAARPRDDASRAMLPVMRTDVVLTGPERRIIIDCKFYHDAFTRRFQADKLISTHLYQIFSYVKNQQAVSGWENCEGLLLYPTVDADLRADYDMAGSRIRAATVDLSVPWTAIRSRLIELVAV